jgi:hypothetical protein
MKKNKFFVLGMLAVLLTLCLVFAGCATGGGGSAQGQQSSVNAHNEGPANGNDGRFDGRWQSADQEFEFEFYADTYILYQNGTAVMAGVFNYTDSAIDCLTEPGMHFVLRYSLADAVLTVNSAESMPDSFVGQWEKIDSPASSATNPLVGTWKSKTDSGFAFYQFYPDGSGRNYGVNNDLTNMTTKGDITYDLNASNNAIKINMTLRDKFGEVGTFRDIPFELNGDTFISSGAVFERQ